MEVRAEAQELWQTLERNFSKIEGTALHTRGLGGRSSGKQSVPASLASDRLYITIEGRHTRPKSDPFLRSIDFEVYLAFEKNLISRKEAHDESRRTSYTGPLVERLRGFSNQ